MLPQRTQVSFPVVTGTSRFLSSYCSGNSPHLYLCPETPCSSPVATGIPGLPQGSPGSQACSRVESKQSAVLSHCDGYLLDTCEWPKGSPASYGVWRGNSGLFSRPCRKRRASSRDDKGISWFFSSYRGKFRVSLEL